MRLFLLLAVLVLLATTNHGGVKGSTDTTDPLSSNINDVMYPMNSFGNSPGNLYPLGGKMPTPRVYETTVFVKDYVIVYGGYNFNGDIMDDLNIYDTRLKQWSGPILRKECCNGDGKVIEASGFPAKGSGTIYSSINASAQVMNNTIKQGQNGPFQVRPGFQGDIPLARAEHAAVSMNDHMYVFGGITVPYGVCNDFYRYNPATLRWTVLDAASGQTPERRAGHSLMSYPGSAALGTNNKLVLFGGKGRLGDGSGSLIGLRDVWTWDLVTKKWTKLEYSTAANSYPAGRQQAATAVMSQYLYVYGGIDPVSNYTYNDMWVFHLGFQTWQNLFPNSGYTSGSYYPPPLYAAKFIPILTPKSSDPASNDQSSWSSLLLYGGLGGGGSCAASAPPIKGNPSPTITCTPLETQLGQIYCLNVSLAAYKPSGRLMSFTGIKETQAITSATWQYARISGSSSPQESAMVLSPQRLDKYYALETIAFDPNRRILYEFGGVKAIDSNLVLANQQVINTNGGAPFLDSGGLLPNVDTDRITFENLRKNMQTPTNGPWLFQQGFTLLQPHTNFTFLRFERRFKTYNIQPIDLILVKTETSGGVL